MQIDCNNSWLYLNVRTLEVAYGETRLGPWSFDATPGVTLVRGETDSGKTSLLMAIGGLMGEYAPSASVEGSVVVGGLNKETMVEEGKVGLVLSSPYAQISHVKTTVKGELAIPLEARGIEAGKISVATRVCACLLGVSRVFQGELAWLSGGELQRVLIASAVATKPKLLLLDQVYTELDEEGRHRLGRLCHMLKDHWGMFVLASVNRGEIDESVLAGGGQFSTTIELRKRRNDEPSRNATYRHLFPDRDYSPVLTMRGLSMVLDQGNLELWGGWSCEACSGEILLLEGANGAGKSLMGRALIGALKPSRGTIEINGKPVGNPLKGRMQNAQVGIAFQDPDIHFSRATVAGEIQQGNEESRERALQDLSLIGLEAMLNRNPMDLCRAERKRLSVVLAALHRPRVLFLDEPTLFQDARGVQMIADFIERLASANTTILAPTHDQRLGLALPGARKVSVPDARVRIREHKEKQQRDHSIDRTDGYTIEEHRKWVQQNWEKLEDAWIESFAEFFRYWEAAVEPSVRLEFLRIASEVEMFIDAGCGAGWYTAEMHRLLIEAGAKECQCLGVDRQEHLLDTAEYLFGAPARRFAREDLTLSTALDKDARHGKNADVITAIFMLHDDPDLSALMRTFARALRPDGTLIATMVNPVRVEAMRAAGEIMDVVETRQKNAQWLWSGLYPLPGARGSTIQVPYFHRSIDHYVSSMTQCGFQVTRIVPLRGGDDSVSKKVDVNEAISIMLVAKRSQ